MEYLDIMRKYLAVLCFGIAILVINPAFALLNLELTRGISGAVPITVVPFAAQGEAPPQDIAAIISNDLRNSGRFKVYGEDSKKTDTVVIGKVQRVEGSKYQISFQLVDALKSKANSDAAKTILITRSYTVSEPELRSVAHHISDLVFQQITGMRGVFSTQLAYIVVQHLPNGRDRHILEVSDQDGFNAKPLLVSYEPIMSPSWSPNGRKIAYVSFEEKRSSVYIQDVATGARRLVSRIPGINGAPAWSPNGSKLALVLSKNVSPNIYMMDLNSGQATQLTNDYYINTEPSWAPDGKSIVFTSNRSGNPQIYKLNLANRAVSRVTYEGKYNARASYTPDGNRLVVLNQDSGLFNIGTLDLDTGVFRILTNSGSDSQSPTMAPNGGMVLFGTWYKGQNVLGMAATDGSIQLRLPARNGEVQDPAWSPFLS
jgi:TolB protein